MSHPLRPTDHLLLSHGRFLDGSGGPSAIRSLRIRDGVIAEIGEGSLPAQGAVEIDCRGKWVTPGFLDTHTHYDAEILAAPGLHESVRHGVTTVMLGSCSLSTVLTEPEDCGDLFARVEALPRDFVVQTLREHKRWRDPAGYLEALEGLALGPNVATMIGHSDMRTAVMGLDRAVDPKLTPTAAELAQMLAILEDALDQGFVGFSTMTNPWDKLDGERHRSAMLPSAYARWSEYRRFNRILRARGRVLQSAPNITTKVNVVLYLLASMGLGRAPLKTALISGADIKAEPFVAGLVTWLARTANRVFSADLRWQSLPMPFEVYSDGIDLVVFEEFGAGQAALHLREGPERDALLRDPSYRAWFKKNYAARFTPRVWHRDFYDAEIVGCPDPTVVGQSIGAVADARGLHPVDAFLDLVLAHGKAFRWRTVIANHRPDVHRKMLLDPSIQMGFADSGAHLRNMAFYDFPLHLLKMAKEAEAGRFEFMSVERAVHRLTGEIADWYDLDTGHLGLGERADLAIIDPQGLDDALFAYHEAAMPGCPGVQRMVRRNDAVVATVIGGVLVYRQGEFVGDRPQAGRTGVCLRAGAAQKTRASAVPGKARHSA